jgi:hypothetical protein
MPMMLVDVFEFMAACDEDPLLDSSSNLWVFLAYFHLSDILNLR